MPTVLFTLSWNSKICPYIMPMPTHAHTHVHTHKRTHKCYIWFLILQYKCMRAFIIMQNMLVVWYDCSAEPFPPKRKLSSAEIWRSWSGIGGVWRRIIRRWVSLGRRRGYEGWGGGCKLGPLLDGTQNVDLQKEVFRHFEWYVFNFYNQCKQLALDKVNFEV